jgi:hypothetical protein
MKNFLFTLFIILVLIGSQSCGKDTDEFIPVNTQTDTIQTAKKDTDWQEDLLKINDVSKNVLPSLSVEKLMAELASDPMKHDLNAERGGTIITPDNVSIEFPANSCITKNNRPCTGTLKVEVLVLRKKGEFLLNNVPTISGGKQLISGGAVMVKVMQNDEEVKLVRNTLYKVKYLPATSGEDGMKLFEGKFEGRFKFDWNLIASSSNTIAPVVRVWVDTAQGRRTTGYDLLIDRFNWINCDKFSNDTATLTNKFCVALPDTFTNQNCSVFAVFKDINSVVSLIGDGRAKQFCVPSGYKGLPVGRVINIITIATIKDRIYIGKKEATISANATIRVEPVLTTKAAAKELISNL